MILKIILPMPSSMKSEIILGIDPGFGRMGYGVIKKDVKGEWRALAYGCTETSNKDTFAQRLAKIHQELLKIIKDYRPTRMAVEELFFLKNVTTAIEVSQARGVILLAGVQAGLAIDEFTPLQVKQAMTGYGRAEKGQMQKIVAMILGIKDKIKSDDAADALAVALCAGQSLWISKLH